MRRRLRRKRAPGPNPNCPRPAGSSRPCRRTTAPASAALMVRTASSSPVACISMWPTTSAFTRSNRQDSLTYDFGGSTDATPATGINNAFVSSNR
jgi:hypothetical protein